MQHFYLSHVSFIYGRFVLMSSRFKVHMSNLVTIFFPEIIPECLINNE